MSFEGFPARGIRFLRELASHNDRAWFAERKAIYESDVLAPMRACVDELSERFAKRRVPIWGDPRRSIFRIYRDVRFRADKRPYKTHAAAYLSRDGGRDTPGGLYLHVDPRGSFLALAFYQLERPLLQRWREAMAANPNAFAAMVRALERKGLGIDGPAESGDALARMPRGFTRLADTPLAPYFRLRSFDVHHPLDAATVRSGRLVDEAVRFTLNCAPLLAYGWHLADAVAPRRDDDFDED